MSADRSSCICITQIIYIKSKILRVLTGEKKLLSTATNASSRSGGAPPPPAEGGGCAAQCITVPVKVKTCRSVSQSDRSTRAHQPIRSCYSEESVTSPASGPIRMRIQVTGFDEDWRAVPPHARRRRRRRVAAARRAAAVVVPAARLWNFAKRNSVSKIERFDWSILVSDRRERFSATRLEKRNSVL